jgi:nucleoside-diphosphate-sugar epimerase
MSRHVVIGAGPVSRAIVHALSSRGIDAEVLSRSGTQVPGARCASVDALDTDRLATAITGAAVVYQASSPAYHRYPKEFPPLQQSIVRAVQKADSTLVVVENLYGYGPVTGPMTESLPLVSNGRKGKVRADMWRALQSEGDAGRLRVTAGRASDFFGPHAVDSAVGDRYFPRLLAGKRAEVMGNPDALHTYTYVRDFGEALVRLALDERSLGRAWHVPNAPAVTNRRFLEIAAGIIGVEPKSTTLTRAKMRLGGIFIPAARELPEMLYEFEQDFVVDHSAYASTFGNHATVLEKSVAETIEWFRTHPSKEKK